MESDTQTLGCLFSALDVQTPAGGSGFSETQGGLVVSRCGVGSSQPMSQSH